jgi:hypothetical protein
MRANVAALTRVRNAVRRADANKMKDKPILEYALHPTHDLHQTVDEFLEEFGGRDAAAYNAPRCPVCGDDLHVVYLRDRAHTKQFAHVAGPDAFCPLVSDSPASHLTMQAQVPNRRLELRQRKEFTHHWQLHFHAMRQHVPTLSVLRFIRLIEQADVLHLWACPTLMQIDVPYILLALAEFIAVTPGSPQPSWLRFWFEGSLNDVADLRRPASKLPKFYRFHYRASHRTNFPSVRHLSDWLEVPMRDNFLNEESPHLTRSDILLFETFLKNTQLSGDQPVDQYA